MADRDVNFSEQDHNRKISLLIVDDSEYIIDRISEMLEENDSVSTVLKAENSTEAIEIYKSGSPDIVILDIRIPGDNGIKTLEKMRLLNSKPLIIMLTNYPYEQYRKKCMDSGADYFFSKSEDFGKIPDVLLKLTENRVSI